MHSITAYLGENWRSIVSENQGQRTVHMESIGYGTPFFKDAGLADAYVREEAHAFREACALKQALDAGVCCEVWFELRDRYGLPLPNWN